MNRRAFWGGAAIFGGLSVTACLSFVNRSWSEMYKVHMKDEWPYKEKLSTEEKGAIYYKFEINDRVRVSYAN